MTQASLVCPACRAPYAPQDAICPTCGLVFASRLAGTPPVTSALPPVQLVAPVGGVAQLAPGQQLAGGRFTIQFPLSRGGMGAIWLATDHAAFDRTVVLKAMLDYFDPANPREAQEARARFVEEARTLAGLRHPAIPQIYTYFQDSAHNYIVMEYVEGFDLERGLTRRDEQTGAVSPGKPYQQEEVLRWGVAVCRILEYLASRQPLPVIHHDIKPANLLLDRSSDDVRLVDFGTARARLLARQGVGAPLSGAFGTQGYAPPEQYRGDSEPRSDVYALAATLYHLATDDDPRDHPFSFPQLSRLGALGQTLEAALAHDVTRRPSAGAMRRELEGLLKLKAGEPPRIQTPDGYNLADVAALAHWCESHWELATGWLYGQMPDLIELHWGQGRLAHDLRDITRQRYRQDKHAGLDAALALFDPRSFGAATPQISASGALDFGMLRPDQTQQSQFVIVNKGRRHATGRIVAPRWVRGPVSFSVAPGQQTTIRFNAQGTLTPAGRVRDAVRLYQNGAWLLDVPVEVMTSRWRTLLRDMSQHTGRLSLLLLTVGLLFWNMAGRSIHIAGLWPPGQAQHYEAGVAAMQRNDWRDAIDELRQSGDDYRDSAQMLHESYYQLGRAQLDRSAWEEARQALEQAQNYKDSARLLRESYTREAAATGMLRASLDVGAQVTSAGFSSDGQTIAITNEDGTLELWQTHTGTFLSALTQDERNARLQFTPDGSRLVTTGEQTTRVWDIANGTLLRMIGMGGDNISAGGELVASVKSELIDIWRISDGALVQRIKLGSDRVQHAIISADGRNIVVINDTQIEIWEIGQTALKLRISTDTRINAAALSLDGQTIAVGADNGVVKIFRVGESKPVQVFSLSGGSQVTALAFSADGAWLAATDEKNVTLFSMQDATLRRTLPGHAPLAFSPDGRALATGGADDKSLQVWTIAP